MNLTLSLRRAKRRLRRVARHPAFVLVLLRLVPLPLSKWVYRLAKRLFFRDSRLPLFRATFEHVAANRVEGDYLEFGVFRGSSFVMAYEQAERCNLAGMRFFAFDSFLGLPEGESRVMKQGAYASPRVIFETTTRKAGVDQRRVVTVQGFFSETLSPDLKRKAGLSNIAVVHVDSDLYSSAKEVLEFIEDIIGPGTVLIFDDWYSFRTDGAAEDSVGERRAFYEWPLHERFTEFYDVPNASKAFVMS